MNHGLLFELSVTSGCSISLYGYKALMINSIKNKSYEKGIIKHLDVHYASSCMHERRRK